MKELIQDNKVSMNFQFVKNRFQLIARHKSESKGVNSVK